MAPAMLDPNDLDRIFRTARTHRAWDGRAVSDATLREIYELMKWGPTTSNTSPARFVFVRSSQAKERLRPALDAGNVKQTMAAPVTAIVAYDLEFYEKLPQLAPHTDARSWFVGTSAEHLRTTAASRACRSTPATLPSATRASPTTRSLARSWRSCPCRC